MNTCARTLSAFLRDHAAVADQHDVLQAEPRPDLVDPRPERGGVAGIAFEHFDRDRRAVLGAQQAIDDLQLALLAAAIVAAPRERAAAAFEIARRHVVEHQRAVAEMLVRQRLFDRLLALEEVVERGVEFVLVDGAQSQYGAQACGGGVAIEHARGGELRGGRQDAHDDHGGQEIAAAACGAEQSVEAALAQDAEGCGDMAVRQRAVNDDGICDVGRALAALEDGAKSRDDAGWEIREVEKGALLDFAALAIRTRAAGWRVGSRDWGRSRCTWGHKNITSKSSQEKYHHLHGYASAQENRFHHANQSLSQFERWKFRG
jgi:hypothetical protein